MIIFSFLHKLEWEITFRMHDPSIEGESSVGGIK